MSKETIADVRAERTKLYQQIQELTSRIAVLEADAEHDAYTINELNAENSDLRSKLEDQTKKTTSAEGTQKYYYSLYDEARKELSEFHVILDAMTGTLPRKDASNNDLSLAARFVSWLASRK